MSPSSGMRWPASPAWPVEPEGSWPRSHHGMRMWERRKRKRRKEKASRRCRRSVQRRTRVRLSKTLTTSQFSSIRQWDRIPGVAKRGGFLPYLFSSASSFFTMGSVLAVSGPCPLRLYRFATTLSTCGAGRSSSSFFAPSTSPLFFPWADSTSPGFLLGFKILTPSSSYSLSAPEDSASSSSSSVESSRCTRSIIGKSPTYKSAS
mmetsp:Transcript_8154/g.19295  ORF Transcript_8154/g.19295 Transcript_8154/m.19295 type:complete len:205 (+) Transcript_8154:728-1342(+)